MTVNTLLQSARTSLGNGALSEAESLCEQVLSINPDNNDAMRLSGIIAMNSGNFELAVQRFSRVISHVATAGSNASDYYNLGLAYNNLGNCDAAIHALQKSIQIRPDLAVVYPDLCLAQTRKGDMQDAIASGVKAVSLLPENPAAHYNLAQAYYSWKKYDSAFKHYKKAANIFPDHPGIQLSLASAYLDHGDKDAASECYRKVIAIYPQDVEAYRQLARINKYVSPDHHDIQRLKSVLSETWLNDADRVSILFALGKIYQDCELYDEAFSYYHQANKLYEQYIRFVPEEFSDYISAIIEVSGSKDLSRKSIYGDDSKAPVFIVGVPRSGTSLVEQILASHPDVYGAGELDWFVNTANRLSSNIHSSLPYPYCISELNKPAINELTSSYLEYVHSLDDGSTIIVDKMPGNFLYLNLIHILFPDAKIIHCRRDPRDSCVSMFTEYFPDAVPYSYNLLKLGAYYKQYERIMSHWRSVLPNDAMLEISYEDMVSGQEEVSRRLIQFIGLEWDDACLKFYQQKRRVDTASNLQVTKPIYSSSVGRWKRYEKHLDALEQGFRYWE